jgi:hypothetical protein
MVDENGKKKTLSGPEIFVEFKKKQPQNNPLEIVETMRSIKAEL